MNTLKYLFLIIAIVSIIMAIFFKTKKQQISKKYKISQIVTLTIATVSFILMIVFSSINTANNNPDLEQISASNKDNIVDNNNNISYVYKTGKNAKIKASGDTSSIKIKKINSTDYKITFHLDKDNYDYISITSSSPNNDNYKIKKTIYNKQGIQESKSEDKSDSEEADKEVSNAESKFDNSSSNTSSLKKKNEKTNLQDYKNDLKNVPNATKGAIKDAYVDENGTEQTVAVLSDEASEVGSEGLKSVSKQAYDTINSYVQTYKPFPDESLANMIRIEDSSGNLVAKTSWGNYKFVG